MHARRWIWLGSVVMALLVGQGTALAGGIVVSLDQTPVDVVAGQPFTVGFTIRSMHNGQGFSDLKPQVTAIRAGSKEQLVFEAKHEGAPGHYAATVMLPSAGEWSWQISPFGAQGGDYPDTVFSSLVVHAPVAAQPAGVWFVPGFGMWFAMLAAFLVSAAVITIMVRRRLVVSS